MCLKITCFFQLRRYKTYVEVLGARILANGEDAEMVDTMMVVQQQPMMGSAFITTDLDLNEMSGEGPRSLSGSDKTSADSVISGTGSSSRTNRYSYRAAIYQHPENPQDIG